MSRTKMSRRKNLRGVFEGEIHLGGNTGRAWNGWFQAHFKRWIRLQNLYVLRLEALGALHDIELDRLALLKAPETVRLNGRKVHEDVFAVLPADKAKSLCVVKPLHCTLFHCVFYLFFC